VQVDTVTNANQELQSLFALYYDHYHDQERQQQQTNGSNSATTITATQQENNDGDNAPADAVTDAGATVAAAAAADSVLRALLSGGAKLESKGLESEVQLRLLRRLNLLMEAKTWKLLEQLEEKQEEKSRLIRQNHLRGAETAKLVAAHEAMVGQKKALHQQRGVKMRVLQQVETKKARLEELKKKARAMDTSLRVEEASYMKMHSVGAAATLSASTTTVTAATASASSVVAAASLATAIAGADASATATAAATAATAIVIPYIPAQDHEIARGGRRLEQQQEDKKEEKGNRRKVEQHQKEECREEDYNLSLACDAQGDPKENKDNT